MHRLLLAVLVATASLPVAAQVGILGGVQGDSQSPSKQFPDADRARIINSSGQYLYTIPLNGARNYNFYYIDGVSAAPNQTFLGAGPFRIEYITSGNGHAAGFDQGRDDANYQPFNSTPSGQPYSPSSPSFLANADVYFGDRFAPLGQLPVNLANSVPINPNAPATGSNIYRGALGIQGVVRSSATGAPIPEVTATLFLQRDGASDLAISTLITNGNGFYSFYYSTGDNKGFIPKTNTEANGRYVIRFSKPGMMMRESAQFIYRPDDFKNPTPSGAVGNRNFYIVGAREFDAGAGLPEMMLDEFTSGCEYVTAPNSSEDGLSNAAPWKPPCMLSRTQGSVEVDAAAAAAYIAATEQYVVAMSNSQLELAARVNAGLSAEMELSSAAKSSLTTQNQLAGKIIGDGVAGQSTQTDLTLSVGPNPVQGVGSIRFALADAADVTVAVFDALGRQVAMLVQSRLEPGAHAVRLETSTLTPGVYIVRLASGNISDTVRFTVVR